MKEFYTYQFEDLLIHQTPTLWSTYKNYNYIIAKGQKAVIIDPGEAPPILNTIAKNNLSVEAIYLTHHHADHVGATEELCKKINCEVIGFKEDEKRLPTLTKVYFEDQKLNVLGHEVEVLFLPGHTLGLCAFYFKNLNLLFSNDLLFSLGCGRVFEGSFEQMYESLEKVRNLPRETILFSSHEYTMANLEFGLKLFPNDSKLQMVAPTIEAKVKNKIPTVPMSLDFEIENNPFLRWDDKEIRKTVKLEEADNWQVFAEIRRLKDVE